jgi:hypothetical protein
LNAQRLSIPPRSAAVLAVCALLVLAFAPAQYFGRQQDDALYLIAARALASGRYCLLTTPGCPAFTVINPGWPALLAPLALFTERPGIFEAFAALLLAASPAALWFWLRRRVDENVALLSAALFASSPLLLSQSGAVMSEAPYLLVLLALLAAADSKRAARAGLWAAALLSLRTAGLAVLPGALAPFLRARRRDAALALLPPIAFAVLWAAWSKAKSGTVAKFALLPATYAGRSWLKPFSVAASNARWYLGEWGACFTTPAHAGGKLALALGAALGAVVLLGLGRVLRRRADDPAAWSLIGSALLLGVWGWQYERYLLTLLPLLIWAAAEGFDRAAAPAFAVLLALQLGVQTLPRLGRPSPWAEPELARTYAWLSARPRPALLASVENVRDGYLTGLPNVPLPDAADAAAFAAALKAERVSDVLRVDGLDYGLEKDPGSDVRRGVARAQGFLDDAGLFRKIHEEPAERAAVYEPR